MPRPHRPSPLRATALLLLLWALLAAIALIVNPWTGWAHAPPPAVQQPAAQQTLDDGHGETL